MDADAASGKMLVSALLMGVWLAAALYVLTKRRESPLARQGFVATHVTAPPPPAPLALSAPAGDTTDRLRAVIDGAPVPIWLRDAELRLIYANRQYADVVGARGPEDAVENQTELGPSAKSYAAQARDDAKTTINPDRVTAFGRRQMMELINMPLGKGEVAGLAVDGTARHQATNALARQMRGLHETLAQLPTGVALFDPGGALSFYNQRFAEFFRLDHDWLDARPQFEELLDQMYDRRRLPETRDFAAWKSARREWLHLESRAETERWTLPSGETFDVRAETRSDGGLLVLFEDATPEVRAAGERLALLAVHQATLDQLQEGVAVFGPDGRLKFANRRFYDISMISPDALAAGSSAEMLMEHAAELMVQPERAKMLRDLILAATAGRTERRGVIHGTLGFDVEYGAIPLPDGDALIVFLAHRQATVTPIEVAAPEA